MSIELLCLIQLFSQQDCNVLGSVQMLSVTHHFSSCFVTPTQFHMHPELHLIKY